MARVVVGVVGLTLGLARFGLAAEIEPGITAPPGFVVMRYADDKLAHDVFCMTIDSYGRVVVSGPGYIKILDDTDGDGAADTAKLFAKGPASGAQGMYFIGRDLLCIGDEGLVRYRDDNGDDEADGPPETFLKVKTGGEHNAHALRRGPDGWWYLIAGNTTGITKGFNSIPHPSIRFPQAGVILRLKPDLSGGEVLADGFRNPYDFDFNTAGDLFTYDADGEQEISTPAYVPSRLLHVLPGGENGWITDNWKRPDYLFDAAPVVATTGRSSPTGMVCYRHTMFPREYRNHLFVLDWSFGRVLAVPLQNSQSTYTAKPVEFLKPRGDFGFAPTDIEIGFDGSMFICVGGRGTHGAVYRVAYRRPAGVPREPIRLLEVNSTSSPHEKLVACLDAPQPQDSWSRSRWVPLARNLGGPEFLKVVLDEGQPVERRVRAIEILTDQFDGVPTSAVEVLLHARSPVLRARAAWSLGVKLPTQTPHALFVSLLSDPDAQVRRRTLEALAANGFDLSKLIEPLARCMSDDDRVVRLTAARLVPRLTKEGFRDMGEAARRTSWKAALTNGIGFVYRTQSRMEPVNPYGIDLGRRILEGQFSGELKFDAMRLIQLSLGDLSPNGELPASFDAYGSPVDLSAYEKEIEPVRAAVSRIFPTNVRVFDFELGRLIAQIQPSDMKLYDRLLAKITPQSEPVEDIHYLTIAARIRGDRTAPQRQLFAKAMLALEHKVAERKLPQDSGWSEYVGGIYTYVVNHDPAFPEDILKSPGFGRPSHTAFLSKMNEKLLPQAIEIFSKAASAPDYVWTNDVVFVVGMSKKPEHLDLVRSQYEKFDLRTAVLMVLSERPDEKDRTRFIGGLDSGSFELAAACINALDKLPPSKNPTELVGLVKLVRQLEDNVADHTLRERAVNILQKNTEKDFGFVYGDIGHRPQPDAIEKMTEYVSRAFPDIARRELGGTESDLASLREQLTQIDWSKGNASRGKHLFQARACANCHMGSTGLGPDLAGCATRFSKEDLFIAIVLPNRDVSPRFRTAQIETKSGKIHTGMVVYDALDGILLRNAANQAVRIDPKDVESKRNLTTSLMPSGLLKELKPSDYADLYQYLRTLSPNATPSRDTLPTAKAEPEKEVPLIDNAIRLPPSVPPVTDDDDPEPAPASTKGPGLLNLPNTTAEPSPRATPRSPFAPPSSSTTDEEPRPATPRPNSIRSLVEPSTPKTEGAPLATPDATPDATPSGTQGTTPSTVSPKAPHVRSFDEDLQFNDDNSPDIRTPTKPATPPVSKPAPPSTTRPTTPTSRPSIPVPTRK